MVALSIAAMINCVNGKSLFDVLCDKLNFLTKPLPLGPPPKPIGGKERYEQICRIQKGIVACFN